MRPGNILPPNPSPPSAFSPKMPAFGGKVGGRDSNRIFRKQTLSLRGESGRRRPLPLGNPDEMVSESHKLFLRLRSARHAPPGRNRLRRNFLKTDNGRHFLRPFPFGGDALPYPRTTEYRFRRGGRFRRRAIFLQQRKYPSFRHFLHGKAHGRNRTTAISGRRMFPPRRQYSARRWEISAPRPWTWPFPPAFPPSSGISAAPFAAPFPTIPSAQAPNSETAI